MEIENSRILVVMSTYNGEKYLNGQIESILNQERVNLTLVIRDDGSKDKTPEIIKEYAEKDSRIIPIYGENIGFRKSFFNTLKDNVSDEYDYYAFADQDDVWMPDKLAVAVRKLEEIPDSIKMYSSSLNVVDQNLNPMYVNSFDHLMISYGSALSRQRLAGCTMVFDGAVANLCKKYDMDKFKNDLISHDGAVYYICLACGGKIIFDEKSYIYFRRHTGTVTEHGQGLVKRIMSVTDIFGKNRNLRLEQAKSILKVYEKDMPNGIRELSNKIVNYKQNLNNRVRLAFDKRIKCGIIPIDVIYCIAIMAGCY